MQRNSQDPRMHREMQSNRQEKLLPMNHCGLRAGWTELISVIPSTIRAINHGEIALLYIQIHRTLHQNVKVKATHSIKVYPLFLIWSKEISRWMERVKTGPFNPTHQMSSHWEQYFTINNSPEPLPKKSFQSKSGTVCLSSCLFTQPKAHAGHWGSVLFRIGSGLDEWTSQQASVAVAEARRRTLGRSIARGQENGQSKLPTYLIPQNDITDKAGLVKHRVCYMSFTHIAL